MFVWCVWQDDYPRIRHNEIKAVPGAIFVYFVSFSFSVRVVSSWDIISVAAYVPE